MRFLALFLALLATPVFADVSYTSSGMISFPSSVVPSDNRNVNAETAFSASVALAKGLIAYGTVSLQRDSDDNSYASKQKLSFGIKAKHKFKNGGNVSIGARYDFDNRNLSGVMYRNLVLTGDYGIWKRLDPAPNGDLRTLSGWANLRYQGESGINSEYNLTTQGRFEIARRLAPEVNGLGGPSLSSFMGLGFGADSMGLDYNHKAKVDAGVRFKWKVRKRGSLNLNIRYTVDHRPRSDVTHKGANVSLSWYVPI